MRNHCSDAWTGVPASNARKRKNLNGESGTADGKTTRVGAGDTAAKAKEEGAKFDMNL